MDRYTYVRSLLTLNKIKHNHIASEAKVTPACVSRVLHGKTQSRPVKKVIARLLKMDYYKVWQKAA